MKHLTALKIAAGISVGVAAAVCIASLAAPVDIPTYTPESTGAAQAYAAAVNDSFNSSYVKTSTAGKNKANLPTGRTEDNELELSDEDKYLLAKLIMAEAEDEPLEGQACVALVVLNRVKSPEFPDDVYDVIFQPGQFTSVSNGRWEAVEPDDSAKSTVFFIGTGWDESKGATYFAATGDSQWHAENLKFLFIKGSHSFYKERV